MAKKYKIGLWLIGICLFLSFFLFFSYKNYLKYLETTSPLVIVENGLSINFLDGNKVDSNNKTEYTFSLTNNDNVEVTYSIYLENIVSNDIINYDLKEKNNQVNILQNELTKEENILASAIKIKPNDTHFYTFVIHENVNDNDKINLTGQLKIVIEEGTDEYFANIIKEDNTINKETTSKVGEEIATTNEGLIESTDDSGTFYYFRGKIENNYVSFADLTWRIVKINSDGSVKLVLDDYTKTTANFYEDNNDISTEEKLDFTKNNMSEVLETWFQDNLKDFEKNIISNKYCLDDSIASQENDTTYYAGNFRLLKDYTVSNTCLGTNYTSKIGLLSADEVVLAGANTFGNNTDYYLHVSDKLVSWWTMTPSKEDEGNITFFEVDSNGKLIEISRGNYYRGIRPVIHLVKKTLATGKGTKENPYIIK